MANPNFTNSKPNKHFLANKGAAQAVNPITTVDSPDDTNLESAETPIVVTLASVVVQDESAIKTVDDETIVANATTSDTESEQSAVANTETPSTEQASEVVPTVIKPVSEPVIDPVTLPEPIQTPVEAPVVQTVVVTPVVVNTVVENKAVTNIQTSDVSAELNSLIERVKATNDKPSIDVVNGFLDYVNLMKPTKSMNEETGIKHQVKLYRLFQFMMNQPLADFNLVMATVLKIVDENKDKGAFGDRYAFRFTEYSPLSKNDTETFCKFMNLLVTISAVNGRKNAIRQIDLTRTLAYGFTDEARQRMLTFTSL